MVWLVSGDHPFILQTEHLLILDILFYAGCCLVPSCTCIIINIPIPDDEKEKEEEKSELISELLFTLAITVK